MNRIRSIQKGFTLVEILIVVIILGILAAIVIPQFTNASQDARKSSLTSQLQTLRSQLELYKLQHLDAFPPALAAGQVAGTAAWVEMTAKTDEDHTVSATGRFGPYLQAPPANPLNGQTGVLVINDGTAAGDFGSGTANPGSGGDATTGWVVNLANGKVWATALNTGVIYDEGNPASVGNTTAP
jgi:general secretion pathway protein G